mgnify:CR=1 FL=1
MRPPRIAFALALCLAGCTPKACSEEERDINREVEVLIGEASPAVKEAKRRLVERGPSAIAILETGLYQADPIGRIRIIGVLEELHHVEAVAVLEHMAKRDDEELVREQASEALGRLRNALAQSSD